MDFLTAFVNAVVTSATTLATGLGSAIPQFFSDVLTTETGTPNVFAIVTAMFLGISFLTWITGKALSKI